MKPRGIVPVALFLPESVLPGTGGGTFRDVKERLPQKRLWEDTLPKKIRQALLDKIF